MMDIDDDLVHQSVVMQRFEEEALLEILALALAADDPLELIFIQESLARGEGSELCARLRHRAHMEIERLLPCVRAGLVHARDKAEFGDPRRLLVDVADLITASVGAPINRSRLLASAILIARACRSN